MSRFVIRAQWSDVPHLSEEAKAALYASYPLQERDARSKGIPALGRGAIYPIPTKDISVPDFKIEDAWPRCYGLDVGWRATAAVWGAWKDEPQGEPTIYVYSCYKRGQAEPAVHAAAIKGLGPWIPGVCDPAAEGSTQDDGRKMVELYRQQGLDLQSADNAITSGVHRVWNLLSTGRLKVFASCTELFAEYSLYRRNEKGAIVKENDHLMDALRYLVMSGRERAIPVPAYKPPMKDEEITYVTPGSGGSLAWMAG